MLEPTMFSIIAKAENDDIQKKAERKLANKNQQTGNNSYENIKLAIDLALSGTIMSLLVWLLIA